MAGEGDVLLREPEGLTRGDPHLPFDEVEARDHLGDGVFDLQAGVHLHEEELVGLVGGDDEFHGAGAGVVDAARSVAGCFTDAGAGGLVEQRRRRFLDDLLVATLQAAFAFAEVDDVAVTVGEDLHLDVARAQNETLEKQRVVAERRRGFATCGDQGVGKVGGIVHEPHALAATAGRRLDQHRVADFGGTGDQFVVGQARSRDTRNDRDSELRDRGLRGDLVSHGLDRMRGRAEECDTGRGTRGSESRVLRQDP